MMNWRHCGFGDDRVTLDMLSVQSKPDVRWEDKVEMAFWRGRDSRRERLDLIRMARRHPDLLNASLTNFFFFRDLEAELGPKQEHVSFFRFFDVRFFSISRGTRFFFVRFWESRDDDVGGGLRSSSTRSTSTARWRRTGSRTCWPATPWC